MSLSLSLSLSPYASLYPFISVLSCIHRVSSIVRHTEFSRINATEWRVTPAKKRENGESVSSCQLCYTVTLWKMDLLYIDRRYVYT